MKNYSVIGIKSEETKIFILDIHYAKRLPQIQYAFGLYDNNELVGVVTYGLPPSPDLCLLAGEENKDKVIELNRLVLKNNKKNEASFLVGNSLKMLPKPKIVISYADVGQNHNGYIYQATNFKYSGLSKGGYLWVKKGVNGVYNHARHTTLEKRLKNPELYERVERTDKHRYILVVGNKREKKDIYSKIKYPLDLPYPKGESKYYENDTNIETQLLLM
tara:strand:+ start:49 stop:702 length:654 start_codon:yes stop_codon:yes gene_type:complete